MDKSLTYNPRLLTELEIECNYKRHKERLFKIETTSISKTPKNDEVAEGIITYKRNRMVSDLLKERDKHTKLVKQNLIIHNNLERQYKRGKSVASVRMLRAVSQNQLIIPLKDQFGERERVKQISQQNMRLRNKLMSVKSTFNRQSGSSIGRANFTTDVERGVDNKGKKRRSKLIKLMLKQQKRAAPAPVSLPRVRKRHHTSLA